MPRTAKKINPHHIQAARHGQLAARSGFTLRAVQYWEQGRKNITLENAALLLDALGLELVITEKGGETHG